jgi:hypothetical protein
MVRHGGLWSPSFAALVVIVSSHVCPQSLPQLQRRMLMSTSWRTLLRSPNNARILKTHTFHTRLCAQKFHSTEFFSATHRDAMRHDPRRHLQPVGPYQRFRRRFDNIPSDYILFGILGINGAVFAAWSYVQMFQVRPTFPSTSS